MLSTATVLPLGLLCLLFHPGISSTTEEPEPEPKKQDIICFVLEEHVKDKPTEFWDRYLPESGCTHWIYSAQVPDNESAFFEQYSQALKLIRLKPEFVKFGLRVQSPKLAMTLSFAKAYLYLEKFDGVSLIWEDKDMKLSDKKHLLQEIVKQDPNKTTEGNGKRKHHKVTQVVNCDPVTDMSLEKSVVVSEDIDLYIVHVELREEDLNEFFREPGFCVGYLAELGVSRDKIALGLSKLIPRVAGAPAWYRDQCQTELGDKMTAVVQAMSCLAKETGLRGVSFWGVSTDDYTGEVCRQGAFPLLGNARYASTHECTLSPAMLDSSFETTTISPIKPKSPVKVPKKDLNLGRTKSKPGNTKPKPGKKISKPKPKPKPKPKTKSDVDIAKNNLIKKGFEIVCQDQFAVSEEQDFVYYRRLHNLWLQMSCYPTNFNKSICLCDEIVEPNNSTSDAKFGRIEEGPSSGNALKPLVLLHLANIVAVAFLFG